MDRCDHDEHRGRNEEPASDLERRSEASRRRAQDQPHAGKNPQLRARGTLLAFPAFADHQSRFRFLAGEPVEPGPWAILQPALDSPHVYPDLVLLPLVAVDRKGTRLGQGKGHYDRAAAELRGHGALLIGVGWAVQMLDEEIPADSWDLPLDGFASPDGVEMFR